MLVTHKTTIDFTEWKGTPRFDVVEGDQYSRSLECTLLENGTAFEPPEGCTVVLRYRKPDHTGGLYDTMPDGTKAWSLRGNILTLELTPQLFTSPGTAELFVTLMNGTAKLNVFRIELYVQRVPRGLPNSQRYINITNFIPQSEGAVAGQYLVAEEVDGTGRVTKVGTAAVKDDPVDADTLGGELPSAYVLAADLEPVHFTLTANGEFTINTEACFRIGRMVVCSCTVRTPAKVTAGWQTLVATPYPAGGATNRARFPDRNGANANIRDFTFDGHALKAYLETTDTNAVFHIHVVSCCGEIAEVTTDE